MKLLNSLCVRDQEMLHLFFVGFFFLMQPVTAERTDYPGLGKAHPPAGEQKGIPIPAGRVKDGSIWTAACLKPLAQADIRANISHFLQKW